MERIATRVGGDTSFSKRPTLGLHLAGYLGGFTLLMEGRTVTEVGMPALPLSEIKAYLDLIGVTSVEERLTWVKMLRALDNVYVEIMTRRQGQERERATRQAQMQARNRGAGHVRSSGRR